MTHGDAPSGRQVEVRMGDCWLRDGVSQTRHMYLDMLAHSLLMHQLRRSSTEESAFRRLITIGKACRAVLRETFRSTTEWAVQQAVHQEQGTKPQAEQPIQRQDEP